MGKELIRLIDRGKKVFLIGIGGVGMSALARILIAYGLEVSGSDAKKSRTVAKLESEGIHVVLGHEASFIERPDWIIFSSAISKMNPDLIRAESLGIPAFHRAEVLSFLMNQVISLAITGAHGKTTSAALTSFLMTEAGLRPTCVVGGEILNYGSNAIVGDPHLFVAEVDESDRSQLYFSPDFALITNLDAEHLDVYKDISDIKSSFRKFIDQVKTTGRVIYCLDDPQLKEIASTALGTASYGLATTADYFAKDIMLDGFNSTYTLFEKGEKVGQIELKIPGIHNVLNSLGVIALLRSFGLGFDQFLRFLPDFRGAGRRLEVKLNRQDLLIIDDYAHHPTEVNAAVRAIRSFGRKTTTVVFQPHRFSRTIHLASEFSQVFNQADRVVLTDIYGAGEKNDHQVDVNLIYDVVKKSGHPDVRVVGRTDIISFLVAHRGVDETIAFLGAGDIGEIADEFASRFENAYSN